MLSALLLASCARSDPPAPVGADSAPSSVHVVGSAPTTSASAQTTTPDDDEPEGVDGGAAAVPTVDGGADGAPSSPEYMPVAGGPHKLAAIATQTWVYSGPNDETAKLGYLRAGAVIDRGEKPVTTTKRCKKGWYRVAPRGFVCDGKRATIDLNHPVVVASWKPPMRGAPLPYRYGRSKEVAPHLYVRVPTIKEQEHAETIKYSERLGQFSKEAMLSIVGDVEPLPPFLSTKQFLPKPFGATQHLRVGPHEGKASSHNSFAFLSVHDIEGRLFGLSTDLNLIPLDRTNLVKLTDIHGGEVDDLPAGIVMSHGAVRYTLDEHGGPKKEGPLERYATVSLTGKSKGDLWETRDGFWVSASTLKMVKKRDSWPSFVKPEAPRKWVDVSVHEQMIVAYEGQKAVYIAQVSTGIGDMGDPEKTLATKRGTFTIKAKHMTATMTGDEAVDAYELSDVPYVQYFEAGYALHAAFWHERFGRPWSHGCVNLTPRDAAWIYGWTDPEVPEGWHGAQAIGGEGSVVNVRY